MTLNLKNKLVLVSGASGLIGASLVKALLNEGARIRALVRDPSKLKSSPSQNIEIKVVDFAEPSTLRSCVQGCQIVFHLAGVLNEFKPYSYYHRVNVTGTKILAELACDAGVEKFIHTSTVWVYGMKSAGPIDETWPRVPSHHFYADSKLAGEEVIHHLIREKKLPAVIVLPSQAYGRDDPSWTRRPLELIRSGRMILVNGGKGLIQPIYIDDLVEGILRAAKAGSVGESYILCGEKIISIKQYFGLLADLVGKERLPSVPAWLAFALAGMAEIWAVLTGGKPIFTRQEVQATLVRAVYNGRKAREELGFVPQTDLVSGMALIKQWSDSNSVRNV